MFFEMRYQRWSFIHFMKHFPYIGQHTLMISQWRRMSLMSSQITTNSTHDDVIKWKHFPRYWPFVRGIHRGQVNSPHKGQWRGALMFSLICVWIYGWVNNREAVDLRRYRAHYNITVMSLFSLVRKKTLMFPITSPSWGESTVYRWIPFTNCQLCGNRLQDIFIMGMLGILHTQSDYLIFPRGALRGKVHTCSPICRVSQRSVCIYSSFIHTLISYYVGRQTYTVCG